MLVDANAASDYLTDMLASASANDSLEQEAITAKAEWIARTIANGGEVEGHDIETVLETVLPEPKALEALAQVFTIDDAREFKALVQVEIDRVASLIAPDLVRAEREGGF
ncbi:hypothetical protein [Shewanella algae]|uniref:hypothetical protein n=1 Tax=Shewanella algae TaxID=38313 RepID=UPI0031F4BEE5